MKNAGFPFRRLLWWCFLAVFVFCGAWIAYYIYSAAGTQALGGITSEISLLRSTVESPAAPSSISFWFSPDSKAEKDAGSIPKTDQSLILDSAIPPPSAPTPVQQPDANSALLAYYQNLNAQNPDLAGWIAIEDTVIDYPVMYTPDDPQKYLHRDFEGRYSFAGLPFLDVRCEPDIPATNLIVYAHNMRSGQMFAQITKYLDSDFLSQHPRILLDTLAWRGEYEVIAVLQVDIKALDDPSMLCYSPFSTQTQTDADAVNAYIDQYASVKAGEVAPGDSILTLSTCKRVGSIDRLVVMARKPAIE